MKKRVSLMAVGVTSDELVFSGMVYVNPKQNLFDLPEKLFPLKIRIKQFILTCNVNQTIPLNKIGMSKKLREALQINLIQPLQINLHESPQDGYLEQLQFQVENLILNNEGLNIIDDDALSKQIKSLHLGKYFSPRFAIPLKYNTSIFIITVASVKCVENNYIKNHILGKDTKISFKAKEGHKIKFKSQKKKNGNLFSADFKIEEMGIGGLDTELTNIFRRAFASRRFPASIIEKFGIKHVKGILLFGPPGTGKTLIARQLAKSLKAKQLKIVNGPEIFSKYVGESQQNVRKLFANSREDEKKYGDQSPLHIIVFDQIDAICKQRGTVNNGTNAQDLVVNQLLTNIDGVQALNNILVIGMTNRKDLIDQAVLRPGRFQVHIEVGLPNQEGRQQILKIHTKTLKQNSLLGASVDLEQLARICKNFTGAQIQALVKSASSFAMAKNTNLMDFSKQLVINENTKVQMEDFLRALQQVKPQFGVDEEKFDIFLRGKLYNYGKRYEKIENILKSSLKISLTGQLQLNSILLQGVTGTGKTSIASNFARNCPFPFVKLISPEQFVGSTQFSKINSIVKVFEDAYRSKQACIILDNIQRLVEFVDIGPRFSNQVLQTLLILLKKLPKKSECRLLIIGTTSCINKLYQLQIPTSFNIKLTVPLLKQRQIDQVLTQLKVDPTQSKQISKVIQRISIKKLLQIKDVAFGKGLQKWKQVYNEFELN